MSTKDRRIEDARRCSENSSDPIRRELLRPVALDQLMSDEANNRAIFEGLMHHYVRCAATGRLHLWAKAAHSAVDLIAYEREIFVKRSDL
jgi:hypothetical protein